jgi:hypothetical protein
VKIFKIPEALKAAGGIFFEQSALGFQMAADFHPNQGKGCHF